MSPEGRVGPPPDDDVVVPSDDVPAASPSGAQPGRTPAGHRRVPPPEQTRDDTDAGWGERGDEDAHEAWLREQRPPHWE